MREIKFRGKSYNSGFWLYGNLVVPDIPSMDYYMYYDGKPRKVYPSTIGQYTGLKDKNGTEIYEGDIVSSGSTKGVVIYDCEKAGFMVQKEQCIELRFYSLLGIEVIGNIHDNNKLIEQ